MSQLNELSRVKARIKALTEKTVSNGCTEAEAMSAAEMVGRLLERYALTMDEIEIRAEQCVQLKIPLGGQRRRPIDGCVPAIARFCECKVWLNRTEFGPCYVFFGFEPDTALAGYLFSVIDRAIASELARFRSSQYRLQGQTLRVASSSFQHGMAQRLAERLEAMHRERDVSVAAQRAEGTALMLVKHRVVDDAFRETDIRLRAATSRTTIHLNGAFRHGRQAGDRVNLDRPIGGQALTRLGG
jgi:hypothetical protein